MDSQPPTTIASLPPELLSQVFDYLASAPPSDTRLNDQPRVDMLKRSETDLKNISLVSRRWHATVLPILFRHVVWAFDRWDLLLVEPGQNTDPVDGLPLLRFLNENDLGRYVDTITMIVGNSMTGMTRRAELGRILDLAGSSSASGSDSGAAEGNAALKDAKAELFAAGSRFPHIINRAATYNEDNNWVWKLLFEMMDPRRITIIASPQMLASLLSRMLFLGDAWSFSRDLLHILSLSREAKGKRADTAAEADGQSCSSRDTSDNAITAHNLPSSASGASSLPTAAPKPPATPSSLFTIRPWTHLLINEGSSTRVYKTYEFFLRRPPSILGALLGCEEAPNDKPLIPPTITSMSYIAIFPLSSHFQSLVTFLPRLDKLYVQLVPRNDILHDRDEMRNVQPSDLWMERNTCYGLIMRKLLTSPEPGDDDDGSDTGESNDGHGPHRSEDNWRHLRIFESGDAADRDAWDMAVTYVRMSATDWHVERDGVFVRGPRPPETPGSASGAEGDAGSQLAGSDDGQGQAADVEILSVPPDTFSPW